MNRNLRQIRSFAELFCSSATVFVGGALSTSTLSKSTSRSERRFCYLTAVAIAFSLIGHALAAFGGTITVGDLVVTQIGTAGGPALTAKGTAAFLDEFPAAGGAMVQQLALPITASGSNNPLTIGGTAGSEGELSLSADGHYLVIAGYDVTVGATTQTSSTIGLIDNSGNINTSTTTSALSGNNTRGATSLDGSAIWVTGPKGIVYATTGSSGASTIVGTNFRALSVVPAAVSPTGVTQLLASSNKSPPGLGVTQFSPALPTAATPTGTILNGMTSAGAPDTYAFFFVDPNTMFVADATDGIQEWTQTAGVWSDVATLAGSYVGLTGVENGNTVSLYATTGTAAAAGWVPDNSLIADSFTFNSGNSGAGTFGTPITLAVATGNSGFSGVAFAPTPVVPEPSAFILMACGLFTGLCLALRRRADVAVAKRLTSR